MSQHLGAATNLIGRSSDAKSEESCSLDAKRDRLVFVARFTGPSTEAECRASGAVVCGLSTPQNWRRVSDTSRHFGAYGDGHVGTVPGLPCHVKLAQRVRHLAPVLAIWNSPESGAKCPTLRASL